MVTKHIFTYGKMIKFSHTIFALPFALSAVLLALREHPVLSAWPIVWIVLAMVGARSAAMGFNRIADARFDANNPRTAGREIPTGKISTLSAALFVLLSSGLFVFSAAMLNPLCFYLSAPVLGLLFSYSFTKRFTALCHLYLGFVISLAPLGAWVAITGEFSARIVILSAALLTYIAGFDIIYACQDTTFDRHNGLFSMPARLGVRASLHLSSLLHALSTAAFAALAVVFELQVIYLITVIIIGTLFVIEHSVVRPNRPEAIQMAFFNINSIISILLFCGIAADLLAERWL